MSNAPDLHRCRICNKPFNMTDRLADFALSAHMRGHEAGNTSPENMIRLDLGTGMWCCTFCDHPLHQGELMARVAVISHVTEHGQSFASPSTGTGRVKGSRESRTGAVGDFFGDLVEDFAKPIGDAIGDAFGAIGRLFDDL
jgi:hypothetical protein